MSIKFFAAGNRVKRQFRAQNLRVEWPSSNRLILRWDHPLLGAPPSYELTHAEVLLSSNPATGRIELELLPGNATSAERTPVGRNNIHIFLLTAIYKDSVSSALHLSGMFRSKIDVAHDLSSYFSD